ncbi:MAG TPA: ABC transporter ATP-binding protein, partial [Mycobacteriales bacterium]|nr:ABC transporter ATP-binding protein [Mycobacteriales bacterium]
VAVDQVSLTASAGAVTGLIGPNGAGKTTVFNACSGLLRPKAGSIRLFGEDVTGASPAQRARRGLGRTFQRVEVCPAMSVRDNVRVGCEARLAAGSPWRQLRVSRATRQATEQRVDEALQRCGLATLAATPLTALSTGQRRLVELARVLACGFRFLLLDEPSSGLDDAETAQFAAVVRGVADTLGTGILLVEHDMSLVMQLCERIHVLDFGHLIFTGTPAQTQQSDVVRAAYLGGVASAVPASLT